MKHLLKKPITFEKAEFWIVTAIYAFSVYVLAYNQYIQIISGHINTPNIEFFEMRHMPYSYSKYYFIPQFFINTALYLGFILVNFYLVKAIVNGRRVVLNAVLAFFVIELVAVILGTADTWIKCYLFANHTERYVYRLVFKQDFMLIGWATLLYIFYALAKSILINTGSDLKTAFWGYSQVIKDCIVAACIWLLSVFFLVFTHGFREITIIWSEIALFSIALYWYSMEKLIPDVVAAQRTFEGYLLKVLTVLAITFFPIAFLAYIIFRHVEASLIINLFNAGVVGFIVMPLSWHLYSKRMSKTRELQGLKTALGRSSANLDFLRSQINPHFLFNALNTLYGTSLQENAERTGEGIQRLGDMMRFMLQENVQEKISLTREVDYLNNYIELQKLRTQVSPDIIITTEIDEEIKGLEIAPMLLIPFVENAFKHGISLREPSHIKISLQTREKVLFFDVSNSIHPKGLNDPERDKSGIGLENVKQRLNLLYPNRHELTIRESAKEFFIHLTVTLAA